jgi:hypothetical protein
MKRKCWNLKIEEFLACLSPNSMYEEHILEDLHGMVMEDIEQGSQGNQDYIESWFKFVIGPQHSILQQFLASYHQSSWFLISLVFIKVYFSNLNMSIFVILLCTWIHWKYSYT